MLNGGPRIQKTERSEAVQLDDVCAQFHTFMRFRKAVTVLSSATIIAQAQPKVARQERKTSATVQA
jgi:hypothetical protein